MADKLSKYEKQRLKEKAKFEREREQWKKQETKMRVKKTRKKDRTEGMIKLIAIVVAVIVALSLLSIYAGSYGIPGRFMPALTVGSQNVSAPEWAFNFSNLYRSIYSYGMYYGLDTNSSLFGQPVQGGMGTWDETFTKQVHQSLQNEILLYTEAKKAGFQLSEELLEDLEATMKEVEEVALLYGMSVAAYLRENYVPGITKAKFRQLEERKLTVQAFIEQKTEEFRALHPLEELREKYSEDPAAYNQVDFRIYDFAKDTVEEIEGESVPETVVRQTQADQAVEDKAVAFLRQNGTEAGFVAAAQALYDAQHQHEEDEEFDHAHDYDAQTATLNMRKRRADIGQTYNSEEFAAWFFEDARKAGDTTTWEDDSSVYAVLLLKPSYAQTTVDFYSINVDQPPHEHLGDEEHSDDEPTPQEQARKSADELYAKWQENGGTEEAFVELVNEQASFTEMEEEGQPGLSEKMAPGDTGVAELDAWLFDPARKAGDAAVIETASNCKVVYLSSVNEDVFAWHSEIEGELVDADYAAYVEELQEDYPLGHHGIGMRFALANAKKMCDEFMMYQQAQNNNNLDYYDF